MSLTYLSTTSGNSGYWNIMKSVGISGDQKMFATELLNYVPVSLLSSTVSEGVENLHDARLIRQGDKGPVVFQKDGKLYLGFEIK